MILINKILQLNRNSYHLKKWLDKLIKGQKFLGNKEKERDN